MGREAVSIGAGTFQFFTRNPRGGSAKAVDEKDVAAYHAFAAESGIGVILAHAPYTLNGCSADPAIRDFAARTMKDDLRRMEYLPGNLYNFHPGSHVGQGAGQGVALVADHLVRVVSAVAPDGRLATTILLETMAGKGSELGRSFEDLRAIVDAAESRLGPRRFGVCLDTCHVWDGGYDVVNNLDGVVREFDRVLGLERLKAVHLNDSMNALAAHKDRHDKIGRGKIGLEAFRRIVNHPALRELPFYLETPCDLQGYKEEISLLKSLRDN